jgi:hypothetical protein
MHKFAFYSRGECAFISAVPQLAAGGISNSADMANIGPGGSVPPQQRYVSMHVIKMKQYVIAMFDYSSSRVM